MNQQTLSGLDAVTHRRIALDGVEVFIREAGEPNAPAVLLHREVASVARQIAECREQARGEKPAPQPHMILAGMRPTPVQRQSALAA